MILPGSVQYHCSTIHRVRHTDRGSDSFRLLIGRNQVIIRNNFFALLRKMLTVVDFPFNLSGIEGNLVIGLLLFAGRNATYVGVV